MSIEKNNKVLPEKWITCKLKDVGEIISGGTPSTNEPSFWGDEISWITPADLSGYKSIFISKGRKSISIKGLQSSSARLIPKGSVLFSSRAPIGYVVIASNELATNQGFKNIVPYSGIDSKYLYYYLIANRQLAEENASGTTFKEISATKFAELPLVLAPSNEQVRISEKLDELLSELEKGKEQLQTSLEQLKVYSQSILKHAFEGKLTNENIKKDKLPNGWRLERFDNLTINYDGNRIPLSRAEREKRQGKYRYYGATGVIDNIDDYIFNGRYLLIGEDGANLVTKSRELAFIAEGKFWVNNHAHIVQAKEGYHLDYIYHYFNSLNLSEYVTGSAQPKLSQSNLNKIPIPIPPTIEEQEKISLELDKQFSIINETEKLILLNLNQTDTLRQTLLQKAFKGKLVEQDPADQPAIALLERIKKEREEYLKAEKEKKIIQKKPMKKKSAAKVFENPLIDTIKEKFGKKSFTFEQLKLQVDINYDDLREELFTLLDNEKILTMEFDQKKESMTFKYTGK